MAASNSQTKRIVAVDDQPEMLSLIQAILGHDYEITTTSQPDRAIELIQQIEPNLVLLDVEMPQLNGWALFRAIRNNEHTKHIPVIIITGLSGAVDKVFGLHIAHVTNYITKPFSKDELLACVAKALEL